MSVMLIDEKETHDWLCPDSCICRPLIEEVVISEKQQLTNVVIAQSEDCPDGWHQVFCVEKDCTETAPGSLDAFVEMLLEMGWAVDSAERQTATCKTCANKEPDEHWASQYEDERGLLG